MVAGRWHTVPWHRGPRAPGDISPPLGVPVAVTVPANYRGGLCPRPARRYKATVTAGTRQATPPQVPPGPGTSSGTLLPRGATRATLSAGPAMSRVSRAALRRTPRRRRRRVAAGGGDTAEGVTDPDMVALFMDFLGERLLLPLEGSGLVARPYHYVLRDTEQQGLCLRHGHLVATSLQGASASQEEPISVVPNRHLERRRCPLIVGIRGGTQALSCGTGPEPRLSLEDVELLELFSSDKDRTTPFTFYKTFGGSTHTFEAAAFPGLFLSTAMGPGEALTLAPPPGATSFYLRRM
uniref:Interleukin-1 receptor antagonist protein-like n=1 Tax=Taeniopygia guttata TaxID=59729 RepID=A0A674H5X1_TAEGU|nr:interleukin-1 receptor antagonist protein-like [Taeniopygia guttata]